MRTEWCFFLRELKGNDIISSELVHELGTFAGRDLKQVLDDFPVDEAVVDGEDVDILGPARRRVVGLVRRSPPPRGHAVPRHTSFYWRSAGRNDPQAEA